MYHFCFQELVLTRYLCIKSMETKKEGTESLL